MLGIYAAATNLRLLDAWASKIGLSEPPTLASRAERAAITSAGGQAARQGYPTDHPPGPRSTCAASSQASSETSSASMS